MQHPGKGFKQELPQTFSILSADPAERCLQLPDILHQLCGEGKLGGCFEHASDYHTGKYAKPFIRFCRLTEELLNKSDALVTQVSKVNHQQAQDVGAGEKRVFDVTAVAEVADEFFGDGLGIP
jgi:hypothetical protein